MDAVKRVGVEHRHNVIMIASVKKGKHKRAVPVIVHGDVITMENVRRRMEKMSIVVQQTVNHLAEVVVKIIVQVYGFQD
jgi:hypothetical protein